ncbi:FAD:protein FMN transferase [Cryptosporangium phraense]|uniref:FAD:protein FMN transferase n=1 Tax=Cryptosporangium phraense TaxID=2593070 RepID=A0A545AWU1_9ACTN|nr:FAD:protein FMN transferase [Cryptosporangium phraense]TQS45741.1 FAD:protein FMN transferase [Cryptosporangium phraense]
MTVVPQALVARLESLWNPTLPDSDLHRLYAGVGTMVPVEPETVALVELATRAARREPDPSPALRDVVIDRRHGRVGLPELDLLDLRAMAPVLTAALLGRYLEERAA